MLGSRVSPTSMTAKFAVKTGHDPNMLVSKPYTHILYNNVVVARMMIHVLRKIRAKKLLHAPTTWLAVHTSVRMKVSITANCKNIWRRLWGHLYSWWKHCTVIGAALPGALYSSARAYHCKWHSSGEDTRSFKARRTGDLSCQRKKHKLQAQCFAVTCRYMSLHQNSSNSIYDDKLFAWQHERLLYIYQCSCTSNIKYLCPLKLHQRYRCWNLALGTSFSFPHFVQLSNSQRKP